MSKKGEKKHLKRLNAPKVRKEPRKGKRWSVSSSPGPHSADDSIPLSVSLRENLQITRTLREAKKILSRGEVQVDGKVRKDPNYPVGVMDVVKVPKTGDSWRVFYDRKGYLTFHGIEEDESSFKLVKVAGKHPFKGGGLQLSLHDGKTMTGDFEDIKVDDTLKIRLPEYELMERIPCEEGNIVFVIGGTNVGRKGEVREIKSVEGPASDMFVVEADGESFQIPEQYVFVIGTDKPEVSLPEVDGE